MSGDDGFSCGCCGESICRKCGKARRDSGSTWFCGGCLIEERDRVREYRHRNGIFKPWQPGSRGRQPIAKEA